MSKGYVVANIRVRDQEKFQKFSGMAGPAIKKYGGKVLARGPGADRLEGDVSGIVMMIEFKRSKKNRSKNALFNPYKNGISSYDMAYLSSKRNLKNKTVYLENDSKKDYLAA